jgi:hypothetical protein
MRLLIALLALTITTPLCAQSLGSTSGANSSVDISNPASSTNRLITTPTVVAPGLAAAGVETCLGSASGGISVMGGGLTFGGTVVDAGCTIRLLARQLYAFGFQKAALALMCQDERVAVAMDRAGSPCPGPPPPEVKRSDLSSFIPALSFAQAEPSQPGADEEQAQTLAPSPEMKPFTPEEQTMFARASNTN